MALLDQRTDAGEKKGIGTKRRVLVWLLSLVLLMPTGKIEGAAPRQVDVEAVFLYHFTQFIDWPPRTFVSTNTPLVIGVLGEHPLMDVLPDVVRNESVRGRSVLVRQLSRPEEATECQIVFISASAERYWARVSSLVRGRPILTVSDINGFAYRGGMIEFLYEARKVKLRIDVETAKAAELAMSSKLLQVAKVTEK